MLFFGHIGITAGVAKACDIFLSMAKPDNSQESVSRSKITAVIGRQRLRLYSLLGRVKRRLDPIDYRMVLLGSFLPDIIDKPVFLLAGKNASLSGRDYAHTLLFNLVLLIGGLVLIRYRKSGLLVISISSFTHLILDQIWNNPVILLWPLFGPLVKGERAGWLSGIWYGLFSSPDVYIPEIIGLAILLLFAYRLVKGKKVISFIRGGAIS
jgi:inner membrane protein